MRENALREEAEHRIGNYYENDEILMMAWYVYQSGGSLSNLAPQTNQEIAKIMMATEDRGIERRWRPCGSASDVVRVKGFRLTSHPK